MNLQEIILRNIGMESSNDDFGALRGLVFAMPSCLVFWCAMLCLAL
jgi:hypothetical protein